MEWQGVPSGAGMLISVAVECGRLTGTPCLPPPVSGPASCLAMRPSRVQPLAGRCVHQGWASLVRLAARFLPCGSAVRRNGQAGAARSWLAARSWHHCQRSGGGDR